MSNKQEQNWQPIKMLSMFEEMLNGQLRDSKAQLETLLQAKDKPHVLDDYTVNRVITAYTEQLDFSDCYERQFEKWLKEEKLSPSKTKNIKVMQDRLEEWRKVLKNILELAKKLSEGTIEKVMGKSDFELGLEFLKKNFDK